MRIKKFPLLTLLPLLAVFAASYVMPLDCVYAKGPSQSSRDSSSDRSSSSSSARDNRSSSSRPSESAQSNRSRDSSSSSQRNESAQSRSSRPTNESSRPSESTQSRSSASSTTNRQPANQERGSSRVTRTPQTTTQTTSPTVRSETIFRSTRSAASASRPRGSERRDYSNLAQIWKERSERRDRATQRATNIVNIYHYYPARYGWYAYDYRPGYTYPSMYCFYYGLFPPYVPSSRIVYVHRNWGVSYAYVDLPLTIIMGTRNYYGYYTDVRYRSLSSALRNIERSWERRDIDLMMDHVRRGARIDVILEKDYAYTVDRQDYFEMTYDAMKNIETASFEFYRLRQRNSSEVVAYGKHVYYDELRVPDAEWDLSYRRSLPKLTVYVSYTMKKYGNEWYITAIGTSPTRY